MAGSSPLQLENMVHKALASCLLSQIRQAEVLTCTHTQARIQKTTLKTQEGHCINDKPVHEKVLTGNIIKTENMYFM